LFLFREIHPDVTLLDIRCTFEAPERSRRGDHEVVGGPRTGGQDQAAAGEVDWQSQFLPAIMDSPRDVGGCCARRPEWFVLRYVTTAERVLTRLLDFVGQERSVLMYEKRRRRMKPELLHWIPGGYMFLEVDLAHDRWQQVLHMPGAITFLGGPTPLPHEGAGSYADLLARCPRELPRPDAFTSLAPGTRIELVAGPCEGQRGVVTRSTRKDAWFVGFVFGAPREVRVSLSHVRVMG
jgi:transcription antitermination factor NusG